MGLKLYHGTSKESVDSIIADGFEVRPSRDMFLGMGLYPQTETEEKSMSHSEFRP